MDLSSILAVLNRLWSWLNVLFTYGKQIFTAISSFVPSHLSTFFTAMIGVTVAYAVVTVSGKILKILLIVGWVIFVGFLIVSLWTPMR